ncbi:MAG: TetR/AcrR family transcriptional regulator [Lachnospiraceae bacterium]|nr:TetR/AcrR family transcriptional regulator [Lachnospiraceae bacterium]
MGKKVEENKRQKRTSLLMQSYNLFMSKGIPNVSIAEIAEKAGVGKGTFYSYFRDKEDLIDQLIARKAEGLLVHALEDLKSHEAMGMPLSVEDKLIIITDDLITELSKDPKLVKFLNRNLHLGFYKKAFERNDFIGNFDIAAMYKELINADHFEWRNPELMLYTIVEFVSATVHSIIIEKEPVDLETYKPYLFSCIRSIIQVFREK